MTSPDFTKPDLRVLRPIKIAFDTLPDGHKCLVADNPNTGEPANLTDEIAFRQQKALQDRNVYIRKPGNWEIFKGGK